MHPEGKMEISAMNTNNLSTAQDRQMIPPQQSNAIDILEQFMKYQLHMQNSIDSRTASTLESLDNINGRIMYNNHLFQGHHMQSNQFPSLNHQLNLNPSSVWNGNIDRAASAPMLSLTEIDNLRFRSNSTNPSPPKTQRCIGKTPSVGNLSVNDLRSNSITDRTRKAGKSTRHRRKSSELLRRFQCPHKDCKHRYEARRSVVQHIKAKHNSIGIEWSPIVLEVGEALGQNNGYMRSSSDVGGIFVWENHSADDFRSAGSSPAIRPHPASQHSSTLRNSNHSSRAKSHSMGSHDAPRRYMRNDPIGNFDNTNLPASFLAPSRVQKIEQNTISSPDPIFEMSMDAHDSFLSILMK
ncbi:hypothetical protein SARC_11572 [Sphaeroforma arctica JP610]|uniref:C2H2-type domain-containing protein n=1 Tax=Sphaeroforma arctica JP610 TaxID=667725 RepID=A0A0L0FHG1_9EUKA|nr:hypothetical protein SARC_11572 [Sphaeroforma arctica JP610]KNC75911.1 hypothetical protein SARC_11572 [Sphaeroforma arctica JP610]|eukprot:XP_014149813.1 hypothetical protein SARC_11572 [Sphaeroforma arctica JP610]